MLIAKARAVLAGHLAEAALGKLKPNNPKRELQEPSHMHQIGSVCASAAHSPAHAGPSLQALFLSRNGFWLLIVRVLCGGLLQG